MLYEEWDKDVAAARASGSGPEALMKYQQYQKDVQTSFEKLSSYVDEEIGNFQNPQGKSILQMFSDEAITGLKGKSWQYYPSTQANTVLGMASN